MDHETRRYLDDRIGGFFDFVDGRFRLGCFRLTSNLQAID